MKKKVDKANLEPEWSEQAEYALGYSRLWCRYAGVWPWEQPNAFLYKYRPIILNIFMVIGVGTMQGLFLTYGHCGSLDELIDAITTITAYSLGITKTVFLYLQQDRMRGVIASTIEDWVTVTDENHRKLMSRYAFWGRLGFTAQIVGCVPILIEVTFTRLPNLSTVNASVIGRTMPLGPSCWAPGAEPTYVYLLTFYAILFGLYATGFVYSAADAFTLTLLLHLCGQFDLLTIKIGKIDDEDDGSSYQKYQVIECAKRHNQLLTYMSDVNDLFKYVTLQEFMSNAALIVMSGVAILINIHAGIIDGITINFMIRIYIWYVQLFMYSFVGEVVCGKATNFERAVQNCKWYNMPNSVAKDLSLMFLCNKSFSYFTAGGVVVVNFEAFKDLTRSMFSLFSVLRFIVE